MIYSEEEISTADAHRLACSFLPRLLEKNGCEHSERARELQVFEPDLIVPSDLAAAISCVLLRRFAANVSSKS